jgi:hypothetical protein
MGSCNHATRDCRTCPPRPPRSRTSGRLTDCPMGSDSLPIPNVIEPIRFDETIDAASTLALFQQIEQANPAASRIGQTRQLGVWTGR